MPAFRIAVVPRCRKATSGTAAASRARSAKEAKRFCGTLGIYEVFLERSGRKIWVKPEPRAEPYIPCYMSRLKRSVGRAQRGTERSGVSLSQEHFIKERGKNLFPLKVIIIANKWTIQNSGFLICIPNFD